MVQAAALHVGLGQMVGTVVLEVVDAGRARPPGPVPTLLGQPAQVVILQHPPPPVAVLDFGYVAQLVVFWERTEPRRVDDIARPVQGIVPEACLVGAREGLVHRLPAALVLPLARDRVLDGGAVARRVVDEAGHVAVLAGVVSRLLQPDRPLQPVVGRGRRPQRRRLRHDLVVGVVVPVGPQALVCGQVAALDAGFHSSQGVVDVVRDHVAAVRRADALAQHVVLG